MTRHAVLTVALLALLAPPALAAGGPITGVSAGPGGVTVPGDAGRYVTVPTSRGTVVLRIARRGGVVRASRLLKGERVVPIVAIDESATGLSADGRTLVLARPHGLRPSRYSAFTVLAARRLAVRSRVRLPGDFTLDAVSPDGSAGYLIETNDNIPARYRVREYDLVAHRLLPHAIVDPAEADEPMDGLPVSRAMSPDGRWAYTLYGGDPHPFIHALDTERGEAKCVDLDGLSSADAMALTLGVARGGTILVRSQPDPESPVLTVDPRTWVVGAPAPAGVPTLLVHLTTAVELAVRDNVQTYAAP